jgi:hypothetical protein
MTCENYFQKSLHSFPSLGYKERKLGGVVDIIFVQLVLWFGMLFLIWALKDSLGQVETTIDGAAGPSAPPFEAGQVVVFSHPENVMQPIGVFQGEQIFRYALIDGRHYEFDHICVNEPSLGQHQRCLAPGLIYTER